MMLTMVKQRSRIALGVLLVVMLLATACGAAIESPAVTAPTPTPVAFERAASGTSATATPAVDESAASEVPVTAGQPTMTNGTDRALAQVPPSERADIFQAPPDLQIDPDKIYLATFQTSKGDIVAELYAREAPQSVNNFVALANIGYYDGLSWHRVAKDPQPFVIQGGDPLGTGEGGPGYNVPAEIGIPHLKGALAWARLPDQVNPQRLSSGSQFYITLADVPFLDGGYTVFGQVVEGLDVTEQIEAGDLIDKVIISEASERRAPTPPPPTPTPEPVAPALDLTGERPLAAMDPALRAGMFNTPPAMQLEPGTDYLARITTDKGDILVDLFEEETPNTVNNFVVLASQGFYDNTTFHRVIEDFMAQAGDPTGTGRGDPGYSFADEFVPELRHDAQGILSMANSGPNTNGSQFFITFEPTPWLDGMHTVFGKVVEGMDVLQAINLRDPATASAPGDTIQRITIETR